MSWLTDLDGRGSFIASTKAQVWGVQPIHSIGFSNILTLKFMVAKRNNLASRAAQDVTDCKVGATTFVISPRVSFCRVMLAVADSIQNNRGIQSLLYVLHFSVLRRDK